jgi:membrane fusion protein, multidrug efflux system
MGTIAATLRGHGPHGRLVRYVEVAAGLLLLLGMLAAVKVSQIASIIATNKRAASAGPPPEAVGSAVAQLSPWESTLSAVGSISGVSSVAISTEVPGIITRIRFRSGDIVERGQVLVELDAGVERAQAASARAQRDLAQLTAARSRNLAAGHAIPASQLDEAEAQLRTARSGLATASAQVGRKLVRAPFKGRLGIRAVSEGQYLTPGTTITSLDAIGATFVDFSLPQEELASLRVGLAVRVAMEGAKTTVQGSITAIDPTVDPSTRNVKVRAVLPDASGAGQQVDKPRPGMFVTVDVIQPKSASVVTVPATAIVHASYGDSVFVIEPAKPGEPGAGRTPDGKPIRVARQQFVRVGGGRGDFVAVTKGVEPGQEVVSAGAFKLRNGFPVVVDNSVKPQPQLDPKPENR